MRGESPVVIIERLLGQKCVDAREALLFGVWINLETGQPGFYAVHPADGGVAALISMLDKEKWETIKNFVEPLLDSASGPSGRA